MLLEWRRLCFLVYNVYNVLIDKILLILYYIHDDYKIYSLIN